MISPMRIALSPCPNDTYLFHAWIAGLVGAAPTPTFLDIQQLNEAALKGTFPLVKVSCAVLPHLKNYVLLPVGAALGHNCGPKLIAKKGFPLEELSSKSIAIPGKLTTAHLLTERLLPPSKNQHFCFFHEIFDRLHAGIVDAGVIIHESRFTFAQEGFVEIADLGELWHEKTQLPLPLGCLVARPEIAEEATEILRRSLAYARAYPEASHDFILQHAQDQDLSVIAQHIALYVNEETQQLSEQGRAAIATLLDKEIPCHC